MSAKTIYITEKIRKEFRAEFPETAAEIKAAGVSRLGDEYAANIESALRNRGENELADRFLSEIASAADFASLA